jgi:hypothetical protein
MELKVFAQDKANHYAYGSWVAIGAAALVMAIAGVLFVLTRNPHVFVWTPTLAAIAGVGGAWCIGAWKEEQDAEANAAALAAGERPRHEASHRDRNATALGALPVSLPLLALQVMQFAAIWWLR